MIGIIAAMRSEVDELLALMERAYETKKHNITFWEGTLSNVDVVLMMSGVGKGNAAMSTTVLLSNYTIDKVINIGTAGGLVETQNVLDLVISTHVLQHDFDTSPIDGESGYGLSFEADTTLVQACKHVFETHQEAYHIGEIASGDQFIAHPSQCERILTHFPNTICVEMEAGAIAQVCAHMQIPFVVLRSLSDVTTHPKSHMDFKTYVYKASKRSATLCKALVASL